MRYRVLLPGLLAVAVCVLVVVNVPGVASDPPKAKPQFLITHGSFRGMVTKVGPDGFELAPGWEGELAANNRKAEAQNAEARKKPLWIVTAGTAAAGPKPGVRAREQRTHWVTDLRIGDIVDVETEVTTTLEQYCKDLIICRRPFGKIPMPPKEAIGFRYVVEMRQAEQDWEEKGVPIPAKHLPADGRAPYLRPPYPPEAPTPHEVKPAKP